MWIHCKQPVYTSSQHDEDEETHFTHTRTHARTLYQGHTANIQGLPPHLQGGPRIATIIASLEHDVIPIMVAAGELATLSKGKVGAYSRQSRNVQLDLGGCRTA